MSPAPSINPLLRGGGTYPFQRLTEARRVLAAGHPELRILDFGPGEPREPTPPFIRRAMADAIEQHTDELALLLAQENGKILPRKRPRGRPRKNPTAA